MRFPTRNRRVVRSLVVGLLHAGLVSVLKGLGGFRRHVVFVMLGENLARDENALFVQLALSNHSLVFRKKIGKNARVLNVHALCRIRDAEVDRNAVLFARNRTALNHAAEAERASDRRFLRRYLSGREEENEVFIEGLQRHEDAGGENHRGSADQSELLGL